MKKLNGSNELEKSVVHSLVAIIEYMPNALVSKTIIAKRLEMSRFYPLMRGKNWLKPGVNHVIYF